MKLTACLLTETCFWMRLAPTECSMCKSSTHTDLNKWIATMRKACLNPTCQKPILRLLWSRAKAVTIGYLLLARLTMTELGVIRTQRWFSRTSIQSLSATCQASRAKGGQSMITIQTQVATRQPIPSPNNTMRPQWLPCIWNQFQMTQGDQTRWSFCLRTSHGLVVKDKSYFMKMPVILASRMSLLMLEPATIAAKVWQCRTRSTRRMKAWAFCKSLWKAQKRSARIKSWPSRLSMITWKRSNGWWDTNECSMTTASPQLTRSLKRELA